VETPLYHTLDDSELEVLLKQSKPARAEKGIQAVRGWRQVDRSLLDQGPEGMVPRAQSPADPWVCAGRPGIKALSNVQILGLVAVHAVDARQQGLW